MEKMKIELKDCCLECEHFNLDTSGIGCYVACGTYERKIACIHSPVCYKHLKEAQESRLKDIALSLLESYEIATEHIYSKAWNGAGANEAAISDLVKGRKEIAKKYKEEISNA